MDSKPYNLFVIPRTKSVIIISAGIGVALIYIISRFFRKKPFADIPVNDRNLPTSSGSKSAVLVNGYISGAKQESSSTIPNKTSAANKRHRHSSFSSTASTVVAAADINHVTFKESLVEETPILLARDSFLEAIKYWERALTNSRPGDQLDEEGALRDKMKIEKIEKLLDQAYHLREQMTELLNGLSPEVFESYAKAERYLTYQDIASKSSRRTLSVLSDDSFASAVEDLLPPILDLDVTITRPIESDLEDLILYQEALKEVDSLNVLCRVLRTSFLKCKSDDDFLAKLYCIRLAFNKLLQDPFKRDWLQMIGRNLITALLKRANKDVSGFQDAYDRLVKFSIEPGNWDMIEEELRGRKLVEFSFYDIVLDFIFMDAFDDLSDPPASVIAVAQNRFLSSKIVESTLSAVVWSVVKAKRTRLKFSDGFIARFYDVSEQVSPMMAWGFLGSNDQLKDLCNYFKSQVCNFLIDLFSCEKVRLTCVEDLAEDVWQICQARVEMTRQYLEN